MLKTVIASLAAITVLTAAPAIKVVPINTIAAHPYTIEVVTKPAYVNGEGMAKATIRPTKGFKWNTKYPANFDIQTTEYTIAKPTKKDIKIDKGNAILCIPYKGEKKGRAQIDAVVSFSVCNEEECLVFRNQKLELSFIVLEKTEKRN